MDAITRFAGWMANHPFLLLLGILCSIVSVLPSIYLAIKGKRRKQPCYAMHSFNILRELVSKLPSLKLSNGGRLPSCVPVRAR
jgi:hypothetical protein